MTTRVKLFAFAAAFAGPALADSTEVRYAEPPKWVIPAPAPTTTAPPPGAAIRFFYLDSQIHLGPNGDEFYSASRMKILSPEALGAGKIALNWNPESGDATVHRLRIVRGDQVTDVLKTAKFEVLRREGYLESSMLSGELTGYLEVPGLQVGDELEFAATVRRKDLTLKDHSFGLAALPPAGMVGAFRTRLLWPASRRLTWRATADVPRLEERTQGNYKELVYQLTDPEAAITSVGAPLRVNLRRLIEYSDFGSWKDFSALVWPMFDKAAVIPTRGSLRDEIERIAGSTKDPERRAEAALQLVQDRIRYVYVGLNGGNFRPATIEETWERRFGDCKAKTVLLVAVLKALGVPAEAVLVSSDGGDGTNLRLPSAGIFDHVLVRARVDDKDYWLDGTRSGDKSLAALPPNIYRWVLPLKKDGAELESIAAAPAQLPQLISVLEIDAQAGFKARAAIKGQHVMRGNEAFLVRTQLSGMSAADAERAVRSYWERQFGSVEADSGAWRYDEQKAALVLSFAGNIKLEWQGDDEDGRRLTLFGAGFTPPPEYRRPKEQDRTAPWQLNYPSYKCWATSVRLPAETSEWKWDYRANPVRLTMGGIRYRRQSDMRDRTVRTVMSTRVEVPEISAAEAEQVNQDVEKFDNNMSDVYQLRPDAKPKTHPKLADAPFSEETDWTGNVPACGE
jgi:hypothetical protein